MGFVPDFMKSYAAYSAEKEQCRDIGSWLALRNRWFDVTLWPLKNEEQRKAESRAKKDQPLQLEGRTWLYTHWAYDLDAEARYEYFKTLAEFGSRLMSPEGPGPGPEGSSQERHECPYCEIVTRDGGGVFCPRCHRKLVVMHVTD